VAAAFLRRLLAHPLTASLELDDPATTQRRKQIIAGKPFLKAIYDEWYRMLAESVPTGPGGVLELGSGAGHCAQFIPSLITSEVRACAGVRLAAAAERLPLANQSLRAIVMTNVLHHLPDVSQFFSEASRVVRTGGRILMIEPWVTPWSRFVYQHLHHEPFDPERTAWSISSQGPLSGANSAMPWIVFSRDRSTFETQFPQLTVEWIRPFLPFRYLVSGGVGLRSLVPAFTYPAWAALERLLEPRMDWLGMFAFVMVRKR
jgi:SAM-dependent methyltransferase